MLSCVVVLFFSGCTCFVLCLWVAWFVLLWRSCGLRTSCVVLFVQFIEDHGGRVADLVRTGLTHVIVGLSGK